MSWAGPLALRRVGILGMNRRNAHYIGAYNPRERFPLVDDKLQTKLIATKAGVSVPALLHVIRMQHEIELVAETLKHEREFVVKPAHGSGGRGILVVTGRNEDRFIKSSGAEITMLDLERHLSNILAGLYSLGGRQDVVIIEQLIRVTPAFEHLSFEGVPDVRLIVFRGYPVMSMLRLATKASDGKANLHQGAVGVGVDIASGRSISAVQFNRPITNHPDTDEPLTGIEVPNWRRLLTVAASCYEATGLGYLGADIVIDKTLGPVLLELNARPGLSIQIANDQGLIPRLESIEAIDIPHANIEDRVDYAVEHFAPRQLQTSLWDNEREIAAT